MLRAHRDASLRPTDAEITCAMGVLVRTDFSAADADKHLFLRHRAAGHAARSSMAWQYVSTLDALRNDSRFAVVPCPDGPFATTDADEMETAKQGSCACKTLWWFRRALVLFPEASFIGKMEDDSVVHSARLVSELRHAHAGIREVMGGGLSSGTVSSNGLAGIGGPTAGSVGKATSC